MRRYALFVGVNNYDDKSIRKLRYSIPDASVLADRFKGFGYTTRLLADPTAAELKAAVIESVEGLGHGDVFLFFFAGHGFTAQDGAHLLFCRDDMQRLLRVNAAGVRVDALQELTDGGGFHRAFLLDSCRTDCFSGIESRGGSVTRDLDVVTVPECTEESGSYFLLRSCDKFRPSLEFDGIGHGLFTQGLLDALDARDGRLDSCDTSFATAVAVKMVDIQRGYKVDALQRPSIECSGPAFSLFNAHFLSPTVASQPSATGGGVVPLKRISLPHIEHSSVRLDGKRKILKSVFPFAVVLMIAVLAWIWSDWPDYGDPARYQPQERYERGESFLERWFFREGNKKCALAWIESAAKDGCADAQHAMGVILEDGELGVGKNEIEALEWYKRAAAQNHVKALACLGDFYLYGKGGIEVDYKAAFSYLYSIATNGVSGAQKFVGDCYRTGELVGGTNISESVRFYKLAAAQGDAGALLALYTIYRYGNGVIQSNQ